MKNITKYINVFISVYCLLSAEYIFAQQNNYTFTVTKDIKTTSVKNQDQTGTCWSFATSSFLESEVLRIGKKEVDLSEMFFARHSYMRKATNYVNKNGKAEFTEGGLSHDVLTTLRNYGAMPNEIYTGLTYGDTRYNHSELVLVLKGIIDVSAGRELGVLSQRSLDVLGKVLDVYLGEVPATFWFDDNYYTSNTFAKQFLGLNADEYIEITSFTDHPYYQKYILNVPDNWSSDSYFNLPLNEMIEVFDNAINLGFTIAWDGDVSERDFNHYAGYAIVTPDSTKKEPEISEAMRQAEFDKKKTTDDHLMHITGMATDKSGAKYYQTKNSWGCSNQYGGNLYMSEKYVRLKTVAIAVHKDAIPAKIAKKMGLVK